MSEQDNNNRNWTINTNLSGLQAPTGGTSVPQGYYKAEVIDMYERPEKPGRIVIKMKVNEGPHTGAIRTTGLNVPKNADDKVRYYWRGFAESVGYQPVELDKGEIALGPSAFLAKTAHIFYTPKDMTSDGYDSIDFLPPVEWTQRAQSFVPVDASASSKTSTLGGSGAATTTTSTLGSGGGNTTSANDVRAKLGL